MPLVMLCTKYGVQRFQFYFLVPLSKGIVNS